MKTIKILCITSAMCILSLCSCECIDGIHGTWKHVEDMGEYGSMSFSMTFRLDGSYKSVTTNNSIDRSWSKSTERGEYMYIGEDEGVLYLYNRESEGYTFRDTAKYDVRIEGRTMYITNNGRVTTYKKY